MQAETPHMLLGNRGEGAGERDLFLLLQKAQEALQRVTIGGAGALGAILLAQVIYVVLYRFRYVHGCIWFLVSSVRWPESFALRRSLSF